ncbi:hypothetical protein B0T22DRAFT_117726 [Podospora appendiculata]|uniref:Uncharacterized protein n=1 Tax=Podospora appendiculata TaxID=314037 RepID=A0AAE1CJ20_9PEZI|nr:hypothetical protein B0T22DRAFT_117726 [Podospora appendiculata]
MSGLVVLTRRDKKIYEKVDAKSGEARAREASRKEEGWELVVFCFVVLASTRVGWRMDRGVKDASRRDCLLDAQGVKQQGGQNKNRGVHTQLRAKAPASKQERSSPHHVAAQPALAADPGEGGPPRESLPIKTAPQPASAPPLPRPASGRPMRNVAHRRW